MIIQHNIPALNSHRLLGINTNAAAKNLEKLSSGFRINRAGDDAAGLAISEKMRGQISGLGMAEQNAKNGISLIQTAEGGLNETHAILQRMRELAVQSSNGTYQNEDRDLIELEYQALKSELDRIASYTNYNGIKLLDGTIGAVEAFNATPPSAEAIAGAEAAFAGALEKYNADVAANRAELRGLQNAWDLKYLTMPTAGEVGLSDVMQATHTRVAWGTGLGGAQQKLITNDAGGGGVYTNAGDIFDNTGTAIADSVDNRGLTAITQWLTESEGTAAKVGNNIGALLGIDTGLAFSISAGDKLESADLIGAANLLDDFTGTINLSWNKDAGAYNVTMEGFMTGTIDENGNARLYKLGTIESDEKYLDFRFGSMMLDGGVDANRFDTDRVELSITVATGTVDLTSNNLTNRQLNASALTVEYAKTAASKPVFNSSGATLAVSFSGSVGAGGQVSWSVKGEAVGGNSNFYSTHGAANGGWFDLENGILDLENNRIEFVNKADPTNKDKSLFISLGAAGVGVTNLTQFISQSFGSVLDQAIQDNWDPANAANTHGQAQTFDFTMFVTVAKENTALQDPLGELTGSINQPSFDPGTPATPFDDISANNLIRLADRGWLDGLANGVEGYTWDATHWASAGGVANTGWAAATDGVDVTYIAGTERPTFENSGLIDPGVSPDLQSFIDALAGADGGNPDARRANMSLQGLGLTIGSQFALNTAYAGFNDLNGKDAYVLTRESHTAPGPLAYPVDKTFDTIFQVGDKSFMGSLNGGNWEFKDDAGNVVATLTAGKVATDTGSIRFNIGKDGGVAQKIVDKENAVIASSSVSNLVFQIGANGAEDQRVGMYVFNMSSNNLGNHAKGMFVYESTISTRDQANDAVSTLDAAIVGVAAQRANLGALQNRLEHTLNNLGVTKENLIAAESSIRDVDMAKEMMEFTKNNILIQASQAMLAQANSLPQGVLQLLR